MRLLDLDDLLGQLGARIFVRHRRRRRFRPTLLAETAWSLDAAAASPSTAPSTSLRARLVLGGDRQHAPSVVTAARKWLDESADADTGLLGRYSRFAMARRLRHQGNLVGDLALSLAIDAEAAGVDIFDDANWTAVAATRDAVLAAVEAVRHDSAPHLVQAGNARYEEGGAGDSEPVSATFDTPWGPFHAGLRRGALPAWVAATEAAERARQSVGDAAGTDAAAAERAWQRDRLLHALRGA